MKLELAILALTTTVATAGRGGTPGSNQGNGAEVPESPEVPGPDLSDLIRLNRYDNGMPRLAHDYPRDPSIVEETCLGETAPDGCCLWPLAFPSQDDCPANCTATDSNGVVVIAQTMIDQDLCSLDATCSSCVRETDFGRTSVTRSPPSVLDASYLEAFHSINFGLCDAALDPAGRIVYYVPNATEDGFDFDEPVPATIDSPLQNLAIFRELMRNGNPPIPDDTTPMLQAARCLGAAYDKGGLITPDLIAYTNRILDLVGDSELCTSFRKEVTGNLEWVKECFIDYGSPNGLGFEYTRLDNFGTLTGLPDPAYIDDDDNGDNTPVKGNFEYLGVKTDTPLDFEIKHEPILGAVPFNGYGTSAFQEFVQAADDARAVIYFMHSWPVPLEYATPQPPDESTCKPTDNFNVLFHDFQVPEMINPGADDREIVVYVKATAGFAATATGLLVKVEAKNDDGDWDPVLEYGIGDDYNEPFDVKPGETVGLTGAFVPADLSNDGSTLIEWRATIVCPDPPGSCDMDHDTIEDDNVAFADTTIQANSGGGRGHLRRGL